MEHLEQQLLKTRAKRGRALKINQSKSVTNPPKPVQDKWSERRNNLEMCIKLDYSCSDVILTSQMQPQGEATRKKIKIVLNSELF